MVEVNDDLRDLDEAKEVFIASIVVDLSDDEEKQELEDPSINYHREAKEETKEGEEAVSILHEHHTTANTPNNGVIDERQRRPTLTISLDRQLKLQ